MRTLLIATTLSLAGLFAGAATASAQDHHVDDLALELQRETSAFCREIRVNFGRTGKFLHLYNDARDMYFLAEHIHEVAHDLAHDDHGSAHEHAHEHEHLRDDVEELDQHFHHMEELFEDMDNDHAFHGHSHDSSIHIGIGPHGIGVQQVHPRGDVRRLRSMLSQIEETLHHLRDDVN